MARNGTVSLDGSRQDKAYRLGKRRIGPLRLRDKGTKKRKKEIDWTTHALAASRAVTPKRGGKRGTLGCHDIWTCVDARAVSTLS